MSCYNQQTNKNPILKGMECGNDLIMPGSASDKKRILKAVRNRTLARRDLNRCAGHVLEACMKSNAGKPDIRKSCKNSR